MKHKLLIGLTCLIVAGCHATPTVSKAEYTNARLDELEAECKANNQDSNANCDVQTLAERIGLICKTTPITGSRIGVRTCSTAEQREQTSSRAKELAHKFQRHPVGHKTAETIMHQRNGS